MEILNENDEEVIDPDLSLGHLVEDKKTLHFDKVPAIEDVPQKIHYEDGKEIIDEEGAIGHSAIPAYDINIPIERYILFTEEELVANKKAAEEMKNKPSIEERLKATEDALMAIMIGGNS